MVDGSESAAGAAKINVSHKTYNFGTWQLDTHNEELIGQNGRREPLGSKECPVLELLIQRRPHVLSRREIIDAVWGKNFRTVPNCVDQAVMGIRDKLDLLGVNGREVVKTKKSKGYRFTIDLIDPQAASPPSRFFESLVPRLLVGAALVAVVFATYPVYRAWHTSIQKQKLTSWNLPPATFTVQRFVDRMDFPFHSVNDFTWLQNGNLQVLSVRFEGASLTGLSQAKRLTSLSLGLNNATITSLAELEQIKGLTSLTLDFAGSEMKDLRGLERLRQLNSLTLYLHGSKIESLAGLEKLDKLTSLTVDLGMLTKVTSVAEVGQLKGLTSLTLDLHEAKIMSLADLTHLKALTTLVLGMEASGGESVADLGELTNLTSLSLHLNPTIKNLAGLEKLKNLTWFSLKPGLSFVTDLAELARLEGVTSLTLDLSYSRVTSLAGLERLTKLRSLSLNLEDAFALEDLDALQEVKQLTSLALNLNATGLNRKLSDLTKLKQIKGLTSLSLALGYSPVDSLSPLADLTGLTSLSIDLDARDYRELQNPNRVKTLAGIERLRGLKSLTLNLENSDVRSLAGLEQLENLTSLTLSIRHSQIKSLTGLEHLEKLTTLALDMSHSEITNLDVLQQLRALTSLRIAIPASVLPIFERLGIRRDIASLWIVVGTDDLPSELTAYRGYKFLGLADD